MNISREDAETLIKESVSKSEVCRKLGKPTNGTGLRIVMDIVNRYNLDISHFSIKAANNKFNRRYELIEKQCPVCNKKFIDKKGHIRKKTTCSHSCSNTYFRSGKNNPNWKEEISQTEWGYRKACFLKWEKCCILCGFDMVVEVHHLDGNHFNNDQKNLIPLCPNHHRSLHTVKYGPSIKKEINEIISKLDSSCYIKKK